MSHLGTCSERDSWGHRGQPVRPDLAFTRLIGATGGSQYCRAERQTMDREDSGGYVQGRVGVSSRSWGALGGEVSLPGQSEPPRGKFKVTAQSWGQSVGYPAEGPSDSRREPLGRICRRTALKSPPCLRGGARHTGGCGACQLSRQRARRCGLKGTVKGP